MPVATAPIDQAAAAITRAWQMLLSARAHTARSPSYSIRAEEDAEAAMNAALERWAELARVRP